MHPEPSADEPIEEPKSKVANLGTFLMWVLLVACTVRLLAAVVGGIISFTRVPHETYGTQVGDTLITAGGFADGQGVLLLLAALGLFWWQKDNMTTARRRSALVWLAFLFGISAVGAVVVVIGTFFYYSGVGNARYTWHHIVASGGFSLTYAIVALGGLYVTVTELRRTPSADVVTVE
jgi:hypothetical protein